MVRRARRVALAALFGVLAPAWACNAIIGIKDLTPGAPGDGLVDGAGPGAVDSRGTDAPDDRLGSDVACGGHRCELTPLASSAIDVEEVRVVGNDVLYRAAASVQTVPIAGGLPRTVVSCANRVGLAVNDLGFFYSWCNTSLTLRDVDGGTVVASATIDGANGAAGGEWFFFRENTMDLWRIKGSLDDAGGDKVFFVTGGYRSFVTTSSELFYMTSLGTLAHMAVAAETATDLEHDQPAPSQIAADEQAVFWATDSDTEHAVLHARPFAAGVSTPIAQELDHPDGIAIDATDVYLALRGTPPAYANGAIVRVPRAGGSVQVLADGLLYPQNLALSEHFVLFTSRGTSTDAGYVGGAIYRLER